MDRYPSSPSDKNNVSMKISLEHRWDDSERGKPSTRTKPSPSATLSTTNHTWTDVGSNLVLRGNRSVTNHVSHDKTRVGNIPSGIAPSDLFVPSRKQIKTNYLILLNGRHIYIYIYIYIYKSKVHPFIGHEGLEVK